MLFLKTSLKKDLSLHFTVTFTVGYLSKPLLATGQSFCFDSWSKESKKLLALFTVSLCQDKPSNYCFWSANTTISHWKKGFLVQKGFIQSNFEDFFESELYSLVWKQGNGIFWCFISWVYREQQMQHCKFHHQGFSKLQLTPKSLSLQYEISTMRAVVKFQTLSSLKLLLPDMQTHISGHDMGIYSFHIHFLQENVTLCSWPVVYVFLSPH